MLPYRRALRYPISLLGMMRIGRIVLSGHKALHVAVLVNSLALFVRISVFRKVYRPIADRTNERGHRNASRPSSSIILDRAHFNVRYRTVRDSPPADLDKHKRNTVTNEPRGSQLLEN
jgi:hypothetical protein